MIVIIMLPDKSLIGNVTFNEIPAFRGAKEWGYPIVLTDPAMLNQFPIQVGSQIHGKPAEIRMASQVTCLDLDSLTIFLPDGFCIAALEPPAQWLQLYNAALAEKRKARIHEVKTN